jgi:CheY-like chemotaxis protein
MSDRHARCCAGCAREATGFVLVVDDDDDNRDVVRWNLQRDGYRVEVATNAREALDHLQGSRLPCAILLDLAMPIMDGWQFMAARRANAAVARIPVALMSGSLDRRALALDANGYLEKPFDETQLQSMVQHCCAGWSDPARGAAATARRA